MNQISHRSPKIINAVSVPAVWALAAAAVWAGSGGCCDAAITSAAETRIKLEDSEKRERDLMGRIALQDKEISNYQERFANLADSTSARSGFLIFPKSIELGTLTGGRNFSGGQGDEGIRVYVTVRDAAGDPIKQAGRTEIELFDHSAGGKSVGRWTFDEKQTAAAWSSVLSDYYYKFDCRWPKQRPENTQLTVWVKFTELLGGRALIAEKPIEIERPASTAPAAH